MKTTTITTMVLILGAFCFQCAPLPAQQPERAPAPTFNYQTGEIVLPNKVATLHLRGNYRYLGPAETEKLLVAWGNPPDNETQGAIVANEQQLSTPAARLLAQYD